jgi:NAD(P)-dependent dehydrogenase (short-subunit alcohol dehydrogenase family)
MSGGDFTGRTVIVTGAAQGLGRATALSLATQGADLVIADINAAGLADTAEQARAAGAAVLPVPTDLGDPAACAALVEQAVARFGGLDALCNVAGLLHLARAETVTVDQWDKVYAVNVRAPFLLFQAALPHLLAREGAVVNVASASAVMGHAYLAPYGSSKGALVALTRSLAAEFIASPIRINAICPGPMNTPMATSPAGKMPQQFDMPLIMRTAGMRPMAEPEDLTDMIVYLASPKNRKVHGAVIVIDQGTTA